PVRGMAVDRQPDLPDGPRPLARGLGRLYGAPPASKSGRAGDDREPSGLDAHVPYDDGSPNRICVRIRHWIRVKRGLARREVAMRRRYLSILVILLLSASALSVPLMYRGQTVIDIPQPGQDVELSRLSYKANAFEAKF